MPINKWMDKMRDIHPFDGLLSDHKKWSTNRCYNEEEHWDTARSERSQTQKARTDSPLIALSSTGRSAETERGRIVARGCRKGIIGRWKSRTSVYKMVADHSPSFLKTRMVELEYPNQTVKTGLGYQKHIQTEANQPWDTELSIHLFKHPALAFCSITLEQGAKPFIICTRIPFKLGPW